MAMMELIHVWFRPFRDELSLKRDDRSAVQNGKGRFRRKNGEMSNPAGTDWLCTKVVPKVLALFEWPRNGCRAWTTNALHYDDGSP